MRYYMTKDGFICVPETHASYFERKFEYIDSWSLVMPKLLAPKSKEPYGAIPTEQFEEYLTRLILEYTDELKKLNRIKEQIFGEYQK